jgi:hypothetical protein
MKKTTIAVAVSAALRRNAVIVAAYKSVSRELLSRQLSSIALSAAGQRKELGEELAALAAGMEPELAGLAIELPDSLLEETVLTAPSMDDIEGLITRFRDLEEAERGLFAALEERTAGGRGDVSAAFHAFAEQSRKRVSVASDHLDLLSLRQAEAGPSAKPV